MLLLILAKPKNVQTFTLLHFLWPHCDLIIFLRLFWDPPLPWKFSLSCTRGIMLLWRSGLRLARICTWNWSTSDQQVVGDPKTSFSYRSALHSVAVPNQLQQVWPPYLCLHYLLWSTENLRLRQRTCTICFSQVCAYVTIHLQIIRKTSDIFRVILLVELVFPSGGGKGNSCPSHSMICSVFCLNSVQDINVRTTEEGHVDLMRQVTVEVQIFVTVEFLYVHCYASLHPTKLCPSTCMEWTEEWRCCWIWKKNL